MKKLLIAIICSILLLGIVLAYSEYGAPAEFGNETTTTCYVGGDDGIVNCTGPGKFAWIDKLEITEPATPPPNTLRLFVTEQNGFSRYNYKDEYGVVRTLNDDEIIVKNVRGTTIAQHRVVYVTGYDSGVPTIDLAKADNISTMPQICVTIEQITNGSLGRCMQSGLLENVNTNAYEVGLIYVSDTTAGIPTNTPPITPNISQEIGTILVKDAVVGKIQISSRSLEGDEFGTINSFKVQGNLSSLGSYNHLAGNLNVSGNVTTDYFKGNSIEIGNGWLNGGLSIIGGDIFAQTGYFYNISSLSITNLFMNGSFFPAFDNLFDLGSGLLRWKDLFLSGQVSSNGGGDNYLLGSLGIGTSTPVYKFEVNDASTTSMNISSAFFVDGQNGRVGIGTKSPSAPLEIWSSSTNNIAQIYFKTYVNSLYGSEISWFKSRSDTEGVDEETLDGDRTGYQAYYLTNSLDNEAWSASFGAYQQGSCSASYCPARFAFRTSDGGSAPLEKFSINSTYTHAKNNLSVKGQLKISGASRVMASMGGDENFPDASYVKVNFTTEFEDNLGEFADSNFTAIQAGIYHIDANVLIASAEWDAGDDIVLRVYINGEASYVLGRLATQATFTEVRQVGGTGMLELNAGDIVNLWIYVDQTDNEATSIYNGGSDTFYNYFHIHRLS